MASLPVGSVRGPAAHSGVRLDLAALCCRA